MNIDRSADRRARLSQAARPKKLVWPVVAALAGGSLATSCQTRVRDAAVAGTKDFFYAVFNPTTFVELLTECGDE